MAGSNLTKCVAPMPPAFSPEGMAAGRQGVSRGIGVPCGPVRCGPWAACDYDLASIRRTRR